MKTICITVKNAKLIQRYLLRSGLPFLLAGHENVRVILLVPDYEADTYRNEFQHEKILVLGMPLIPLAGLVRIAYICLRFLISDRLFIRYAKYKRARGLLSLPQLFVKIVSIYFFSFFPGLLWAADRGLKYTASFQKAPDFLMAFFDAYKPDVVFATSLAESKFDAPILLEARCRGILTAGTARGWSSIGAGARYLIDPDVWLVQDQFMKEMAQSTQYVPENQIRVSGFPYFDWFTKNEFIISRESFLRPLGIDPRMRVILYAGSGEGITEREIGFARIFEELVREGKIPSDTVLLFRPHPYHSNTLEQSVGFQKKAWKHVFLDHVELRNMKRPDDYARDHESLVHLMNSFAHSEMVITPGSTLFIEAAAFKKPLIALAFDSDQSVPYWLSFARRYDGTHSEYKELLRSGGIRKASSREEFARAINGYLENSLRDAAGFDNLYKRFVAPCDGKATERLADELLMLVSEKKT